MVKFIEKHKNIFAAFLSLLGSAFIIYYIFRASKDVISSDYIRIINYYLNDVKDLQLLFSWEGFSRIPITFLFRYINRMYFSYSVFFDKIIGVAGLFLLNFIVVKFILNTIKSPRFKIVASVLCTLVSFSLMPWEMILNGTGYPHFFTTGLIALTFYLFDRIVKRTKTIMTLENLDSSDLKYYGIEKENNRLSNMVALIDTSQMQRINLSAHFFVYLLTICTSLFVAGSYCISFCMTLIFFSAIEIIVFFIIRNKYNKGEIDSFDMDSELYRDFKDQYNNQEIRSFGRFKGEKYSTVNNESTFKIFFKFLILIIISIISITCFMKSNQTGEALVPVGFKDITLTDLLMQDPKFPLRFFLKSFASSILGVETFNYAINFKTIDENMIFFVGCLFVFIIIVTFIIQLIKLFLKDKSNNNIFDLNTYNNVFPIMFVVYGLANYVLVFLARYAFVKDDYGMMSRYGLQYMFLTIGLLLINFINIDSFLISKRYYKEDKTGQSLSKSYLKRREKLIAEGKIKLPEPELNPPFIIVMIASIVCVVILIFGHMTTTMDEIFKADYRKIAYTNLEKIALEYDTVSDDMLETAFEYHRNVNHIKTALSILKRDKLNVFK